MLEDHADTSAKLTHFALAERDNVLSENLDAAGVRLFQTVEAADEGRFAGAASTNDPQDFAALHRKRHAVDGRDRAKPFGDVDQTQHRLGLSRRPRLVLGGFRRARSLGLGGVASPMMSRHERAGEAEDVMRGAQKRMTVRSPRRERGSPRGESRALVYFRQCGAHRIVLVGRDQRLDPRVVLVPRFHRDEVAVRVVLDRFGREPVARGEISISAPSPC